MEIDNSKDESRQGLVGDQTTLIPELVREKVARGLAVQAFGGEEAWDEFPEEADAAISAIYEALQEAELPLQETFVFGEVVLLRHQFEKVFHGIFKSLAHLHEQHRGERR